MEKEKYDIKHLLKESVRRHFLVRMINKIKKLIERRKEEKSDTETSTTPL